MKRTPIRAALAAIRFMGFTQLASAVPIHIDFTGTVTPGSSDPELGVEPGAVVSGGFTLETDEFIYSGLYGTSRSWTVNQLAGPMTPLATLNFGDRSQQFPVAPGSAFGILNFTDDCTPASCSTGADSFSLYVSTGGPSGAGFTGIAHTFSF